MISIYTDRALSVIKKYDAIFAIGGTGFTLDVYEDDSVLTYDGTGANPGTYAVTYEASDLVIGSIGSIGSSCAVTSVSQVLNQGLENTTVTFTITGTTTSGVTFSRTHRYTYLVISDGENGGIFTTVWKGESVSDPANPVEGWMYRNSTTGTTLLYVGSQWVVISIDGISGTSGDSVNYIGSLSEFPTTPSINDTFRYTIGGVVYTYTSSGWESLVYDGPPGAGGLDGIDGNTLFITYHDAPITSGPVAPIGEGNTSGWHYNPIAVTNWMSQKISSDITLGTWSDPILMTGLDGQDGYAGIDGQRGSAWYNGEVGAPIDALETLVLTGDPAIDDPATTAAEEEDALAWETAANSLYTGWDKVIVDGDVLTLLFSSVTEGVDDWSEARMYSSVVGAWVPAGMYVDGSLLVEGSIWAKGAIRSGTFDWQAGSLPTGFMLSGEGLPDPNGTAGLYNIVGGNIYGGNIVGATLTSSGMPYADVTGAPNSLSELDSAADSTLILAYSTANDAYDYAGTAYSLAGTKITSSQVNPNVTSIDGGVLTTGTINAIDIFSSKITGSSLEATNSAGTPPLLGSGRSTSIMSTGSQVGATGYGSDFGVVGKTTNTLQNTSGLYGDGGRSGAIGVGGVFGVVGQGGDFAFYATGSGANYGPFTGAHDGLVYEGSDYTVGDIVCDSELVGSKNVSNTLFRVTLSSVVRECTVGVVVSGEGTTVPGVLSVEDLEGNYSGVLPDGYASIQFNAVGEGMLNVCGEGGDIQNGDLIVTSSTPGKGMRQSDGIVMNYTVAKARGNHTFTSTSEVKMIPCIYLCG